MKKVLQRFDFQRVAPNFFADQRRAWLDNPGRPDLAIVCFSGQASLPWLTLLRPGFRHCCVLLRCGGGWVHFDPLAHFTFTALIPDLPVRDLAQLMRRFGYRTVLTRPAPLPSRTAPWRPHTCVEAVKRTLCLDAPWVLTPWQLFRLLQRRRRSAAGGPRPRKGPA